MADIVTDAMVVGPGPAGAALAVLLATYTINTFLINLYGWLANTSVSAEKYLSAALNKF